MFYIGKKNILLINGYIIKDFMVVYKKFYERGNYGKRSLGGRRVNVSFEEGKSNK